ncbi:hypothetical protein DL98DRAFT_522194 [Cadophora sp. DSE1049]|nr:hypothetical protein DL98DRAFT_522194 [Cadophora sp. DSE1049]
MFAKITQARIQELESLQRQKADLQERIQAKKDEMTKIRDGMESEGTAMLMCLNPWTWRSTACRRKCWR